MLPQHKLVATSIILSIIFLLGLIAFKYFFPKRKINLFYLLILISILPIVSIFRIGTYESGDLSLHTQRLMSFYNLLINYNLIPRWTPEFNAGYGDPHFLFAYFLPYFIGSIFHIIGFSFLMSMKLLLAFSFVASGITMYFWAKDELGKKPGFVAAIFYLFMPYHLVDIHFRATVAENLSFVFLPFILLAIKKNIENHNKKWLIALSISFGLLILSHQAISVMFLPLAIMYCFFIWKRKNNRKSKDLIFCFISIILGFLLTSFYWMPIIFLAKFTQHGSNLTHIAFPNLTELLYSPWRYGFLFQGHKGEMSVLIGYAQLLIIFVSIYFLFKKMLNKKLKDLLIFFLTIFIIIFIMMLPITEFIWKNVPLLKYSQFSTRLLVLLSLCISIIAGIVVKKINKTWFIAALCFITIFYTILNWGNRRTVSIANDNYLRHAFNLNPDVSSTEPTSPMWTDLEKSKLRTRPKSNIEILKGHAEINEISRTPISHIYKIITKSNVEIKENTLFFPGWLILANDKQILVNYKNPKFPGIMTFSLNKGTYDVKVKFTDLPIIIFSKWISGLSFLGLLIYVFTPKKSLITLF
jgi:4-amino-4-deoxy-L-arabinose transferase-like glycosyltransferase